MTGIGKMNALKFEYRGRLPCILYQSDEEHCNYYKIPKILQNSF